MQVKNEMDYMLSLVEDNINLLFVALEEGALTEGERISSNEAVIDSTNAALTKFLIKLSVAASESDERIIGSHFRFHR